MAVNRPQPDAVAVVVSTEHLPVGAALGANQTAVRHAPAELVPADAVGADTDLQGAIVASVLGPGEILTEADLRAASVLHGRTETERSVFVPVPDRAVLAALSPGDAVDLHSPVDGAAVVAGLTVLSVDRGEPGGGMWLGARPEHVSAVAAALGADPAGGSLVVALRPLPPRG